MANITPHNRSANQLATGSPRPGFTLVEMLMVIIIVGILAALVLFGATKAMSKGRAAQIQAEIDQLGSAIENYRTERGSYPPTMGPFAGDFYIPTKTSNYPLVQQARIQRHIAKAFPRYTGNYVDFRNQVCFATASITSSYGSTVATTTCQDASNGNANVTGLDVNNLDPAETLVFWLSGLPDPTTETKVGGFALNAAKPFWQGGTNYTGFTPSQQSDAQRTKPIFPFDPRRLVDYDQDGWWEYLPPGGTTEGNTPSYVYFDSNVYGSGPAYPFPSKVSQATGYSNTATLALSAKESLWGNAKPYGSDITSRSGYATFVNSKKFQIITAGVDNAYSEPIEFTAPSTTPPAPTPWWFDVHHFPSGTGTVDQDSDNLTNFAKGPVGEDTAAQP